MSQRPCRCCEKGGGFGLGSTTTSSDAERCDLTLEALKKIV